MPNFSHLDDVPEVRETILFQSSEDYVVCYELILNEKLKKNRVKLKEVHLPQPTFTAIRRRMDSCYPTRGSLPL
jgi:hypothetical protein